VKSAFFRHPREGAPRGDLAFIYRNRPKSDNVPVRHLLGFLDGFLVAIGLISMDAFTMKSGSASSFLVTNLSSVPDSETWSLIHSAAARTSRHRKESAQ
jgi:hypothetical protein